MNNNLPVSEKYDPEGFFLSLIKEAENVLQVELVPVETDSESLVLNWKPKIRLQPISSFQLHDLSNQLKGLAFALEKIIGKKISIHDLPSSENRIQDHVEKICPGLSSHMDLFYRYSQTGLPIFIHGEQGTGKSFLARNIHQISGRKGSLVELHLEAIPEGLIELELYGAIKGAFTDANQNREGKLAAADKGTLVIENVENLSKAVQGKLVDFLGSFQFYPLGSNEPRKINCMVICTSRLDTATLLEKSLVLPSFIYNINALPLHLDSLASRMEDRFFFFKLAVGNTDQVDFLYHDFLQDMNHEIWSGNIPQYLNRVKKWLVDQAFDSNIDKQLDLKKMVEDYKRSVICDILRQNNGNRTKTARMLGLQRTYLAKLIRDFQIEITSSSGE